MKINQTRNYGQFESDTTNRPITDRDGSKLRTLRASMKKYGFLPFPIIVKREGDHLRIIDGQHRFSVAKELGLPISWVETDRNDIVIAEVAAAQCPWSLIHYVGSFAAQGAKDYESLLQFSNETSIPLGTAASLLIGDCGGAHNVFDAVKNGKFKVKDVDYARRVASILGVIKKHVPWAMVKNSVNAISRFVRVKEFDDAQMIKRIETHPHMLRKCATLDTYSEMYAEVYNYSSRTRIPLAFLAGEVMSARSLGGKK